MKKYQTNLKISVPKKRKFLIQLNPKSNFKCEIKIPSLD